MRWKPKTEDDIRALTASGDLDESHHLDAKREIGRSKAAHRETARDLASFAIDGGALIIGVGESDDHTFYCSPVDVDSGIVEQLEQIAANTVRPPLDIRVDVIRAEEGGGYLFVTIPASPSAPHMADGRYYGRGERTRRNLDDAEVARLISRRTASAEDVRQHLKEMHENDPYEKARGSTPTFGHLYLYARPRTGSDGLAEGLVWGSEEMVREIVFSSAKEVPRDLRQLMPATTLAGNLQNRMRGRAQTTLGQGRRPSGDERRAVDIEIRTDGSIAALMCLLSDDTWPGARRPIHDGTLLAWTWQLGLWARHISAHTNYNGVWDFGIRGTGLATGVSRLIHNDAARDEAPVYDSPIYEFVTSTRTDILRDDPARPARELTMPLLRSLGSWSELARTAAWDVHPTYL
ncbi:helix-turn-helix domain-containing protein [Frigoribacterium sp. CFBP 13707]|uniref:AlbA family DNA-binding domain-containing protein n=1 Tax=Frigoribacterium sp. CFBP 13707 TaxID=2775313 RepID=UPI00177BF453|nr:ATP-binding protein [Frigoribacterium sp. CFBP 13707]MBD8728261.1 hypothetical protein [Frigoribacterium sp. CFBP 13707]